MSNSSLFTPALLRTHSCFLLLSMKPTESFSVLSSQGHTSVSLLNWYAVTFPHFYRAMLCIRGTSHGLCPCLSQAGVLLKTAKCRITQTTPHDTPGTLVFRCQRSPRNSTGVTPLRGRQMQVGWVKIGDFRQITGYIAKTVKDRHIVSIKVE